MKTKSWLFTLGFCVLLLSGCAGGGVGVGTGYGHYPPVQPFYSPYYGGMRPYYYRPRPAVVAPRGYYRQPHRTQRVYRNEGGTIARPQYHGGSRNQVPIRRRVN